MASALIPTCTVEITRTGSSSSRSAACAPREPASARACSATRRAVTIAVLAHHEERVAEDQGEQGDDAQGDVHRAVYPLTGR